MSDMVDQPNPFKVFTPEDMDAERVHKLFVDPFTDFNKIRDIGHTMVNGPRGCGKSMIFRYMLPDCQCLARGKNLRDLEFLAFLISIKNTGPNLTDLRRLEDRHADAILNEHFLTSYVASKAFGALSTLDIPDDDEALAETVAFFHNVVRPTLLSCGLANPTLANICSSAKDVFESLSELCDSLYCSVVHYARRLSFSVDKLLPYESALCGYVDFLLPVFNALKQLSFLPSCPAYLLIDDADYLNRAQTVALNSWISTRTQQDISIKVSTQLRYKTFATNSGLPIQSPHDYQAINIADVYTTRRSRYLHRVEEIVQKRLTTYGVDVTPSNFFPPDQQQEAAIADISVQLKAQWEESGRGHRPEDDAVRYARPDYIRSLTGRSKSGSTYSYSGFEHLVHISSGLVRYFLEAAAMMFDEEQSRSPGQFVQAIRPGIQNDIVRAEADALMFSEFEKIRLEEEEAQLSGIDAASSKTRIQKQMQRLQNLIMALGGAFKIKLLSDDSERRVFSVAISGRPDAEIIEVFELGVRYGYFHRSSIGNKDGTGRTRLYVLTRRLAPFFSLDPTTFAGYLWISNDVLMQAMEKPETLLRKMKQKGVEETIETGQMSLFE